jgi:uncharacterized membrane protein YphA (DoxX/SURF4 family)
MKRSIIIETIALLFMILFLYTGISKLMDYTIFREQIAESPILKPIAPLAAICLPITELILFIALLHPRWRLKGLYGALLMMLIFTVYIIGILSFNDKLPCSCGGALALLTWPQHLLFNCTFILLGFIGIALERKNRIIGKNNIPWAAPEQPTFNTRFK